MEGGGNVMQGSFWMTQILRSIIAFESSAIQFIAPDRRMNEVSCNANALVCILARNNCAWDCRQIVQSHVPKCVSLEETFELTKEKHTEIYRSILDLRNFECM